jgi:hypothetical protein
MFSSVFTSHKMTSDGVAIYKRSVSHRDALSEIILSIAKRINERLKDLGMKAW